MTSVRSHSSYDAITTSVATPIRNAVRNDPAISRVFRIHTHRRTDCQHDAAGRRVLQEAPLPAVESGPIDARLEVLHRVNIPFWMVHFVADQATAAACPKAPRVFLKPMFGTVGSGANRGLAADGLERVNRSTPADRVLSLERVGRFGHVHRQAGAAVRLVVEQPGCGRDQPRRHEFTDKTHTALILVSHVEPQVPFGEVAEARPTDAQHAGFEELEADEAGPSRAVSPVQVATGGQEGPQQFVGHGIVRQNEVAPAGSQEGAAHGKEDLRLGGVLATPCDWPYNLGVLVYSPKADSS